MNNQYIGEVYIYGREEHGAFGRFPVHDTPFGRWPFFQEFTAEDRKQSYDHDDFICIFGKLHKLENVIIYNDIYNPQREEIKKRNLEQNKDMNTTKKLKGIDLKHLTEKDTGRWVVYTPGAGKPVLGRVKSWNDKFIFVVYSCDNQWDAYQNYTGESTDPKDLVFCDGLD